MKVRNLAARNESCHLGQVIVPETPVKVGVTLPVFREEQSEVMLGKHSEKQANHT